MEEPFRCSTLGQAPDHYQEGLGQASTSGKFGKRTSLLGYSANNEATLNTVACIIKLL